MSEYQVATAQTVTLTTDHTYFTFSEGFAREKGPLNISSSYVPQTTCAFILPNSQMGRRRWPLHHLPAVRNTKTRTPRSKPRSFGSHLAIVNQARKVKADDVTPTYHSVEGENAAGCGKAGNMQVICRGRAYGCFAYAITSVPLLSSLQLGAHLMTRASPPVNIHNSGTSQPLTPARRVS